MTKTYLKGLIYDLIQQVTGKSLQWGMLTGIRPTKLAFKLYNSYGDYSRVKEILTKDYRVSAEKADLLIKVVRNEQPYLQVDEGDKSIYIGVPFCPSKCSYCTFPSYRADKWPIAYKGYTDALIKEMEAGADYFKDCTSIYIGGGTPTSLTEDDFDRFMAKVKELLGDRDLEFTVEAGRPDTITTGKLMSMKRYSVNRISINPQTMQDRTLERIGRKHLAKDVVACFEEARALGFDHINMDLILGLPGESAEDTADTIRQVLKLRPESITVHTLAFKRGSKLSEKRTALLEEADLDIHRSLAYVQASMAKEGYEPYYLYRQKHMVGQYENVGYCLPGKESIYNIRIMEEVEDIVAFGAGGISKKILGGKITRSDEPKDVNTYMMKLDEIISKKSRFFTQSSQL